MLKSYKTEINPTEAQAKKIRNTIGVCRYVYNFFIAQNQEWHKNGEKYKSWSEFSKWINNEYLPQNPDKEWIKDVSTKSVKQSIINADTAYKKFFKGESRFPRFKKKGVNDPKMYFVKNDAKMVIECERHRIKIPTLGWVRLKEKGYIPTTKSGCVIKSGTVSMKAGRYYVSCLVEVPDAEPYIPETEGVGIDLGIKDFATESNDKVYANINKTAKVRKIEKKLRREQRRLSRKYESLKKRNKEGEVTRQNIQKQKLKVQRLHQRVDNIRTDYVNNVISETVKAKPFFITIEDLNVKGMMKNRHLSKAISGQKFGEFRTKMVYKCHETGTEIRIANRFYPSSKTCHNCGNVKKDLKLKDRIYRCEVCGYVEGRDKNGSLNLRDTDAYEVA